MRTGRRARRVVAATLAFVVLTTMLVAIPGQQPVAAWPPTPPGVPPGRERIPFQIHVLERTEQLAVDSEGRPWGRCHDEIYLTFDKRYGLLGSTSTGVNGRGYSFYEVSNYEGGSTTRIAYSTSNVFGIRWPAGTFEPGFWYTVDHHDQIVYRPQDGFGGVSNSMSGLLVDTGGHPASESWCSPTKRGDRQQAMRESIAALELWTSAPVHPPVDVTLAAPAGPFDIGDEIPVTMTIENITEHVATGVAFEPASGLGYDSRAIEVVSSSGPALPTSLQPGQTVTRQYIVRTLAQATTSLTSTVTATVDGATFNDTARARISVPPEVEVVLTTDVGSETKAGDEFTVTATITNNDEVDLLQVDSEFLSTRPVGPVKWLSGPLTPSGRPPDVEWVDLSPGETTTFHWTYLAEDAGVTELTAHIRGVDTTLWTDFNVSASTTVAIETTELVLDQVRLQPGHIVPGQFGNIRGTVTNAGSTDVTDIDFSLESNPELLVVDGVLAQLDPSISPRIPRLEPDETREFMIPVAMVTDAGALGSYRLDLRMAGTSTIDGEDVEVAGTATAGDGLDLSPYWSTILGDVRANLFSDTMEFFEGLNDWGESSTIGGVVVGSSEGALAAFQKMGDGLLGANDYIAEEIGSGGERLSETANSVVAASREYLHTHSLKEMRDDLQALGYDVTIGGVGTFAEWLRDVDRAQAAGDVREVSRLLAEPATGLAIAGGGEAAVERVAGNLFTRLVQSAAGRKAASYLKRAPKPVEEDWIWLPEPDYTPDKLVARELQDLKDLPTGVAITGETVARAGLTADEHGWMIDMAREHGVAFFVRPRPEIAAKFARLGYNAKPMAIKLKSINEIDHKWLGWDDYADSEGLVVFREPEDPLDAMKAAVEAGELEYGGPEIDDIIARYNLRRAEWKSFEKPFGDAGPTVDPREGILHKLNGDTLGPDGQIVSGNGFTIQRYGTTVNTKVTIDPDGVIRFTHNNQPVYSDIDLMAIARPDGTPIDPELHKLISEKAGFGIDSQHGDTALTSDFPNWEQAEKFGTQYTSEHTRGGDPLVIIQPDVTTLGYVDSVTVPAGPIQGSGYDLYGKLTVTYEGAGRR